MHQYSPTAIQSTQSPIGLHPVELGTTQSNWVRVDLLGMRQGLFGRINLIPSNNLCSVRAELDRPDD